MDINVIKQLLRERKIIWTNHVITRLIQRNISQKDVEEAILQGEIIEEYNDDFPYPSCLIMGINLKNEILHVVCGIKENSELWIITSYFPDEEKWEKDNKTRKENK